MDMTCQNTYSKHEVLERPVLKRSETSKKCFTYNSGNSQNSFKRNVPEVRSPMHLEGGGSSISGVLDLLGHGGAKMVPNS